MVAVIARLYGYYLLYSYSSIVLMLVGIGVMGSKSEEGA